MDPVLQPSTAPSGAEDENTRGNLCFSRLTCAGFGGALQISSQDKKLWCAWSKAYPVDEWERARNERIISWQGEGNILVSDPEALQRICNN